MAALSSPRSEDTSALARWRTERLIKSRVKSIKARGGTAEEQLAALADRVKDEVWDIEHELQTLLKKPYERQSTDSVEEIDESEYTQSKLARSSSKKTREYRRCACGCGELVLRCEDEASDPPWEPGSRKLLEELDKRERARAASVDVHAQRAKCQRLSRCREPPKSTEDLISNNAADDKQSSSSSSAPGGGARPPDYGRLSRLAKPRELPEPPADEHPFQPQLLPRRRRAAKDPSNSNLPAGGGLSLDEEGCESPEKLPPVPFGPEMAKALQTPLAMLRYNAKKTALTASLPALAQKQLQRQQQQSQPQQLLPRNRDPDGDFLPRLNVRSAASQQKYTEERLYTKPKHAPGSLAGLMEHLNMLRQQNQELRERALH